MKDVPNEKLPLAGSTETVPEIVDPASVGEQAVAPEGELLKREDISAQGGWKDAPLSDIFGDISSSTGTFTAGSFKRLMVAYMNYQERRLSDFEGAIREQQDTVVQLRVENALQKQDIEHARKNSDVAGYLSQLGAGCIGLGFPLILTDQWQLGVALTCVGAAILAIHHLAKSKREK